MKGPLSTPVALLSRYQSVRQSTLDLAAPLSPEDCQAQSMPEASPVKWHLGHTTWFFETFVLERIDPSRRRLFNSYYQALGEAHPKARRGLLTRPSLEEVIEYRRRVDEEILRRLEEGSVDSRLLELGLEHEMQHQELLLTDVKHLLSLNPLQPSYATWREDGVPDVSSPLEWISYPGGVVQIGCPEDDGFAFDNERPRHRRWLEPFELASRPTTCGEYLEFIADGGYRRAEFWLSDGWDACRGEDWRAPLYWEPCSGGWRIFTLSGPRPLKPNEIVCHVSYYEADAFARWAGARLPAEDEWEAAAMTSREAGNFAESRRFHPEPVRRRQMRGDVWEWTRSAYAPYPGYRRPAGALGEYNSKFMCNQLVLRGGSCATPEPQARITYRNFFPPQTRWQFSGIRLAR